MTSLPEKLIFPVPFAGGEGSALTPIALTPIKDATDAAKVNFFDGFPSSYSAPHENGGNFVTRGQLNAIGNLASKNEFYRMCGGINTFDQEFADKIGGYPKDAILDYFDGINLLKVISLVADNKYDFNKFGFGGKWAELGTNNVIKRDTLVADLPNVFVDFSLDGIINIGYFTAQTSGLVSIRVSNLSSEEVKTGTLPNSSHSRRLSGTALLGKVFKTPDTIVTPSYISGTTNYNGYSIIGGLPSGSVVMGNGSSGSVYPSATPLFAEQGDIISIFAQNGYSSYVESAGGYQTNTYYGNNYDFSLAIYAG